MAMTFFFPLPPVDDVGALVPSERLLLWALRRRVLGVLRAEPVSPDLDEVLSIHGVAEARLPVVSLVEIVGAAATGSVHVNCPGCRHLALDEAALLAAVAASQRGAEGDAARALARLLPSAGVRLALPTCRMIASAFAAAGEELPHRTHAPWATDAFMVGDKTMPADVTQH
jgi:hypothetical protein